MADEAVRGKSGLLELSGTSGLMLFLAVLAVTMASFGGIVGAVGVGLAIVLTTFTIGVLIGFLFSVPRVFAQAGGEGAPQAGGTVASETGRRLLQTNTNLERISDWLSTMLVGVGLSQVGHINDGLLAFRRYVGEYDAGDAAITQALAVVSPLLLLTGVTTGFIAMYLYTRVVLVGVFNDIEGGLSRSAQQAVADVAQRAQAEGAVSAAITAAADTSTPVTATDGVNVMYDLLYQPDGYHRVIELGQKLKGTPADKEANYWFYLAAAYGQMLADAQARDDSATAQDARVKALQAAGNAVQISPAYRSRLWAIADPKALDNDLAPLRQDDEFLALVKG